MTKEQNIITVGFHKGEMDFGVNASIADLSLADMNQLRIMTMVAIGQAESMWRHARESAPENQAFQSAIGYSTSPNSK